MIMWMWGIEETNMISMRTPAHMLLKQGTADLWITQVVTKVVSPILHEIFFGRSIEICITLLHALFDGAQGGDFQG
jgi:hypothetical protein